MPSRRFCLARPSLPWRLIAILALIGGLAGVGLAWPSHAWAQGAAPADLFTVSGVDVDVSAANGTAAKEQALADGQRQAFQQLLERLTTPADRAKLSKVDGANYVLSFNIDRERALATRYIATLTVRFNAAAVKKLLSGANIAFTDVRGRPLVVVPVYKAEGRLALWDDPNPWRAAWAAQGGGGLVPLVVPGGEVGDVQALTAEQALGGDTEHLAAEGARFGAAEVLVAAAALSPDGKRLDVTLAGLGGTRKPFDSLSYTLQAGETADQMIVRAARDVARAIDAAYKQDSTQAAGQAEEVSAIVPLRNLDDWLAVRGALARTRAVRSYDVVSLSRNEAALVLHTVGGQDRVKAALAETGLSMDWAGNYWTLRLGR